MFKKELGAYISWPFYLCLLFILALPSSLSLNPLKYGATCWAAFLPKNVYVYVPASPPPAAAAAALKETNVRVACILMSGFRSAILPPP